MTPVHIPVLAGELIDLTSPAPGDTAVDCTFGAGGHARLVAERLGPAGTLVCIDRDPAAEARFDELAAEVACETRFLRMDYADGLALLAEEGLPVDVVYLDLGISSMQVDARERGFSYSYDAPLDMRMDPGQELDARAVVNEWDERQLAQIFRRNGELDSLDRALPLAWNLLRPGGRFAAISFHSLEDRRVKRFLAERARGCICPPDFPVCVCGHEPEVLTGRAVAPTAGEVAQNPRAKSGRLRAARRLATGDEA